MCSRGVISPPPESQFFEKKDQLFCLQSKFKLIVIHSNDSWRSQIEQFQCIVIGSSDVAFLSSVLDDIDALTRKVNMSKNMLDGVIGCVQLIDAIDYTGPNVQGGILIYKEAVHRQHESGYHLNERGQNARAYGVALLQMNTDPSISSDRNKAGILDSTVSMAVPGSQQMLSNVIPQATQGRREEALVSSCGRYISVHVEGKTVNARHVFREVSVMKKRIPNCEKDLQALKKSKRLIQKINIGRLCSSSMFCVQTQQ